MFDNSYVLIILVSILVILSYGYSALSHRSKIPSVLMLLLTGIIGRIAFDKLGYQMPPMRTVLEFFGIVEVYHSILPFLIN